MTKLALLMLAGRHNDQPLWNALAAGWLMAAPRNPERRPAGIAEG